MYKLYFSKHSSLNQGLCCLPEFPEALCPELISQASHVCTLVNVFERYCSVKDWRVSVSYSVILLMSSDSETHRYKTSLFSVIL